MKMYFNTCLFLLILCIGSNALARDNRFALSRSGQIIVKGDHYYPPFEFINEDGRPDGFNVELFRALAEELGLDYRLELGPWSQVRNELESGQIDVLMGMIYSPERTGKVKFGIPHSVMTYGIFTRTNNLFRSLDELKGRDIIVQDKDRMHDYLIESGLSESIITVPDQLAALKLLSEGRHDAALLGNFQGAHLIRKHNFQNITVTSSDIDPHDYAIAVSQNNDELLRLLDMGLYHLKAIGTYDELYKKWFSVYEEGAFYAWNRGYILLALAVFVLLALFILVLRLRVKSVKKQLKESDIRYHNIFANEYVAMLIIDSETGLIADVNPAAEKFYGYSKSRMTQMHISDITLVDTGDILIQMSGIHSGEKRYFAFRHRLATGEIRDVDVYSVKIYFNGRNYLYTIVYDATERWQAENNARELQGMLEYIIRHDPNAIAVLDNHLRFIFVSDRFIKDYNVKDREIIGKHHYDIFPDISDRWKDVHQRALRGEVSNKDDDTYIRRDGTVEYTRWECRPWHKLDGSIGGIILYTEVISKRKRVEIELEKLKNKLEIEVKDKTAELEERIKELERFHDATIEREFRIKELRDEVERLAGAKS